MDLAVVALIAALAWLGYRAMRDSEELGCGCTGSLLLIFVVVVIGVIGIATGGTFEPR